MVRVTSAVMHGLMSQTGERVPVLQLPGVAHGGHGGASRGERVVMVIGSRTRSRAHGTRAGDEHRALVMMVTTEA